MLSALIAPNVAAAKDADLASGRYEDSMLIAFNPATGAIHGYFNESRGEPGQFSCIFYLTGTLRGSKTEVSTFDPETPADDTIKGELTLEGRNHFQVKLPTDHGGCANVQSFVDQPADFTLQTAYPWTTIAVVKPEKAYFYDAPGKATHRKAYVVQYDGLGVRSAKPGWLEVDFINPDGKRISGWVRQADVYPVE
jgi:hypothetical protein